MRVEMLSAEAAPKAETSAVIEAFTASAKDLDSVAQHLAEVGSPGQNGSSQPRPFGARA